MRYDNYAVIWNDARRFLRRTRQYRDCRDKGATNYELAYVLIKPRTNQSNTVAVAFNSVDEMFLKFNPYHSGSRAIYHYDESLFDIESDIFESLNNGFVIADMSLKTHDTIWFLLDETFEHEELKEVKGLPKYLQYCKRKKVTKELLNDRVAGSMIHKDMVKELRHLLKDIERSAR